MELKNLEIDDGEDYLEISNWDCLENVLLLSVNSTNMYLNTHEVKQIREYLSKWLEIQENNEN